MIYSLGNDAKSLEKLSFHGEMQIQTDMGEVMREYKARPESLLSLSPPYPQQTDSQSTQ